MVYRRRFRLPQRSYLRTLKNFVSEKLGKRCEKSGKHLIKSGNREILRRFIFFLYSAPGIYFNCKDLPIMSKIIIKKKKINKIWYLVYLLFFYPKRNPFLWIHPCKPFKEVVIELIISALVGIETMFKTGTLAQMGYNNETKEMRLKTFALPCSSNKTI